MIGVVTASTLMALRASTPSARRPSASSGPTAARAHDPVSALRDLPLPLSGAPEGGGRKPGGAAAHRSPAARLRRALGGSRSSLIIYGPSGLARAPAAVDQLMPKSHSRHPPHLAPPRSCATTTALMNLAGYQDVIAKDADTALKVNISWHFFFPGSSTTPVAARGRDPGDEAGRLRPGPDPRLPQPHGGHRRPPRASARTSSSTSSQAHGLRNVHLYEGEEWINIRDAVGDLTKKFLCLNEVYPKGFSIPQALHRREHHPPADGQDARVHDDDRGDEERVRRPAQRAPALDAPGHPRDAGRPADDPEEDPPRRVRGDGRHVRRRRARAALHDAVRQERAPGLAPTRWRSTRWRPS